MGLKLNGKYWMIRKTHPKVLFSEYDSRDVRKHSILDFTRTLTIDIDSDTPVADIYKHITKSDMRSVVKEQAIYSESKYVDEIPEILKEAVYEYKEFNEFALADKK